MNAPELLQPTRLFITRAPRDVQGWAALFDYSALPVLARTAAALEEFREMEDAVDAHMLAETINTDPLMTLKLLAHVAHLRRGREGSEVETVTEALVMLGIPPFFKAFGPQEAAEDRLASLPRALEGFNEVLRRSHRAARFAIGFAVHRMDHDAAVIHEAALLHDFAEMLLWAHAPSLALQIRSLQEANPEMRTAAAQRSVLGVRLADVQQALMLQWRLPELLVRISNDHVSTAPQVRNVQLAIRVARHSSHSWDNPALPDDLAELSNLLNLSPPHVQQLLLELDN